MFFLDYYHGQENYLNSYHGVLFGQMHPSNNSIKNFQQNQHHRSKILESFKKQYQITFLRNTHLNTSQTLNMM